MTWRRLHMLEEFKKFVFRGNVVDLAVGVVHRSDDEKIHGHGEELAVGNGGISSRGSLCDRVEP